MSTGRARQVPVDVSQARADRLWHRVSERLVQQGPGPRRARRARAVGVLLAMTAAFAGGWWLAAEGRTSGAAQIATSGAPVSLTLADGSRLELAPETQITLEHEAPRRVSVRLTRGTVDCTVAARPERRFSVAALGYEVVARGTRFSVSLEHEQLAVDLREGKVDVYRVGASEPEARVLAGGHWSSEPVRLAAGSAAPSQAQPVPLVVDAGTPPPPAPSGPDLRNTTRDEQLGAPRLLLDRGNALRREGDLAGAARAYEALLTRYPGDTRAGLAAFELGRLRMDRLNDVRGASQALEQATRSLQDAGLREDALARLVRALDSAHEQERCLQARAAYLETHPTGIHVRPVASACGVGQ